MYMDYLKAIKELGLGSRLKRLSEYIMKETQLVYDYYQIDFDPYLFPAFQFITQYKTTTTTDITEALVISQPAVTQVITKLSKKGYIQVTKDQLDKRKKNIALSEQGSELHKILIPIWNSIDTCISGLTASSQAKLIDHLDALEAKFAENSFSNRIINYHNTRMLDKIEIVPFQEDWATVFKDLNIAWLEKYFVVEPHDQEVLLHAQTFIIDPGGHIFFAKSGEQLVGTVALIKISDGVFELSKMAVSPEYQGQKIGQKLMQYCIDFAKEMSWEKLVLYSNTKLENAIYIYRKFGFKEIAVEKDSPYLRSNIKMEHLLN